MAEKPQVMIPRDIVTPSATILGLILTALGILVALAEPTEQVVVRNFAILFIIVVALFVLAVISTVLSSLLKRTRLWSAALVLYVVGWSVLGSIMIIVLLGYAYGIEMLQVQLPEFNLELVLTILSIVTGISSAAATWLLERKAAKYRNTLKSLSEKVDVTKKEFDMTSEELTSQSIDLTNSLVVLRSDIERELRRLARVSKTAVVTHAPYPIRRLVTGLKQADILNPQLAYSILFVYNFCSRAVHGEEVPQKDALLVRELGVKTLISLRNLVAKYQKQ